MNKSVILATAISAILAAPLANAAAHGGSNNVVYGKVHASVNNYDDADNWQAKSNSSRLGFKGSEDLGNGMKVIYKYELSYDVTDGGGVSGTNRNSYVGLAGDFGTVKVGRHDTPAKSAFYASGNDALDGSMADLNTLYGFTETRQSNIILYHAPKMGDLALSASIAPGEGSGPGAGTGGNPGDGLADQLSVGAVYKSGPMKLGFGYTDSADLVGATDLSQIDIGGTFNMGMITLGLQYQTTDLGGGTDLNIMAVTAKLAFGGNNALLVNFGNAELDTSAGSVDEDASGIALMHMFSKRSTGYVSFASSDIDVSDEGFSVGLIHNF